MEGHLCRRMLAKIRSHINEKRKSYELRKSEKRVALELQVGPKKIRVMTGTGGVEFLGPLGRYRAGRYRAGPVQGRARRG